MLQPLICPRGRTGTAISRNRDKVAILLGTASRAHADRSISPHSPFGGKRTRNVHTEVSTTILLVAMQVSITSRTFIPNKTAISDHAGIETPAVTTIERAFHPVAALIDKYLLELSSIHWTSDTPIGNAIVTKSL